MNLSRSEQDLNSLTKEQLDQRLQALQRQATAHAAQADELEAAVQELHVHRIELEMQNRALRETQSEIEQSVQRYADLYDNLPIGYVTVTATGEIVSANRAASEWLRPDSRALVGRSLGKFFDPYDAGRFAAHLEICLHTGGPATLEVALRRAADEIVTVQLSSRRAAPGTAEDPRVHIAITDMTKMKEAQRVLEAANLEQEALQYSIAHDLRAPLVTIANYASIVVSDFGAGLDPQAKGMVDRMGAAAKRLEDTLKHLLDYSTMGRDEIVVRSVNVESVMTDLLIAQRSVIEQTNADVLVERPLPTVRAARDLLSHALGNLLSNALKYTKPGEPPHIQISSEMTATHAILKVSDQGLGIDRKYHDRIFKVFERLHGYSRFPGSGMGLAIAKRAVERMNGRIWCDSEMGKGSCFCIELPKG